jgi:hypothetical protein
MYVRPIAADQSGEKYVLIYPTLRLLCGKHIFAAGSSMLMVLHVGGALTFPVGIRHHGEPCTRNVHARKPLEATMQEIVVAVCKMCCGDNWEMRYEAGLRKWYESNRG